MTEKILNFKSYIFWTVCVVISIGLLTVTLFYYKISIYEIQEQTIVNLTVTFISFVTFGLLYKLFTNRENKKIITKQIASAIQLDEKVLSFFDSKHKENFIESNLKSILGSKRGRELYRQLIKKNT